MLADWIELCELFNAHRVEFLLVGGQAVIAHGYPRLTKDMDLWVCPTVENGRKVLAALTKFGTPIDELRAEQFEDPRTLLMLGLEPFRIDILTDIPGVTFSEAWARHIEVTLDGVVVPVIGKADLIKNKRAVGRLQDLADAEELEKIESDEPMSR
jgi:hypothetical protein